MKLTVNEFKQAMRQDGNFANSSDKLAYLLRAIKAEGKLTNDQQETLLCWAYWNFD